MNIEVWQLIVAIIGSGTVTGIVQWILNRGTRKAQIRDTEASTVKNIQSTYISLLDEYRKLKCRVREVEQEKKKLEDRIDKLERDYRILTDKYDSRSLHNEILVRRVKLLARILSKILSMWDKKVCLNDLIKGVDVSEDDKQFLSEMVEEVNNVHSSCPD